MFTTLARRSLAALAGAATALTLAGGQLAARAEPAVGPPYDYQKELMHSNVVPLYRQAMITRTEHGYLFRAGMQNSHLVIKPVPFGLRFTDTGTARWKRLAPSCRARNVRVGVAAVCRIPAWVTRRQPLLVEVWPRLGDDFVDGSRLPVRVAMTVLGDLGNEIIRTGAGPDFVNGAAGRDRVSGGGSNDWIRTGLHRDLIWGGGGHDRLIGVDGPDVVYGGPGNDRVGGSNGDDRLQGDAGSDYMLCGDGIDSAWVDAFDTIRDCEAIFR